ncbi:MAG: hypothetical protein K6G55_03505 [Selenomonadaceae bacterium]|nr:hypothetical protein [Selenomonadaceae bacterium]
MTLHPMVAAKFSINEINDRGNVTLHPMVATKFSISEVNDRACNGTQVDFEYFWLKMYKVYSAIITTIPAYRHFKNPCARRHLSVAIKKFVNYN